jgi:osmotically-inducible protein OsmY
MHASIVSTSNGPALLSTPTGESTLEHRVFRALEDNPHLAGRRLRFETHQGRVVLRGVVSSYYQKQMAQESLRRLEGIEAIENQLQVAWQ